MTFCYFSHGPLILLLIKIFVPFWIFRKIKVWDLVAALDPRAPAGTLCLRTLVVRTLLFRGGWGTGRERNETLMWYGIQIWI